ncbi:MAG: hypothetical protein E6I22_06170 [Chloroflexi bacterium]|nr:MAG: hypothetical protein E6I22_06170 [Chloroflexota bacterium]
MAAGALIQGVLGIEFLLAGLSKAADSHYLANFKAFVATSPGAHRGPIAPLIQAVVTPHPVLAAWLAEFGELAIGIILLVAALETARRRFAGRVGAELAGAAAGLGLATIAGTIFLLDGGILPTVNPAFAFSSAIPVELMMVPLGLGIAWLELGRFAALRHARIAAR